MSANTCGDVACTEVVRHGLSLWTVRTRDVQRAGWFQSVEAGQVESWSAGQATAARRKGSKGGSRRNQSSDLSPTRVGAMRRSHFDRSGRPSCRPSFLLTELFLFLSFHSFVYTLTTMYIHSQSGPKAVSKRSRWTLSCCLLDREDSAEMRRCERGF